jgi:hypothetical protein
MAIIDKTSSWYSIRGRVGGLSVSSNAQNSYIRALKPPNPSASPSQAQQRADWSGLFGLWRSLGPVLQGLWNSAAATPTWTRTDWYGNPYQMSGLNLFLAINRVSLTALGSQQLTPPNAAAPANPPGSTFTLRSSSNVLGCQWTTAGPWNGTIAVLRLEAHAAFNASQNTSTRAPKLVVDWPRAQSSPYELKLKLEASFGLLPLNYRMFFHVTSINTQGRKGTTLTYSEASLGT